MSLLSNILRYFNPNAPIKTVMRVQRGEWPERQVQKVEIEAKSAFWVDIVGKVYPERKASDYKPVIDALCNYWPLDTPYMDAAQFAYVIATIEHECGFVPKHERRADRDKNDHNRQIWEWQNRYWHTGYYGRGLPQITWRDNYVLFGRLLGIPLAENPELAMDVDVGARIVIIGMWHGLFTGKRIDEFISVKRKRNNWVKARSIYNGDVRKNGPKISEDAQKIYALWKDKVSRV